MKGLDKYEKLKKFQAYRFSRNERHIAAVYLNAIRKDDTEMIDYFESFGNDLHHILLNSRTFGMNVKYGFDNLGYNEYDWIIEGRPDETKRIIIDFQNYVYAGVSPNRCYFSGVSFMTSTSGRHSGASIWGKAYETEKDALVAGLEEMTEWYQRELKSLEHSTDTNDDLDDQSDKTPKVSARKAYCKKILNIAKSKMTEIKEPQLSLF